MAYSSKALLLSDGAAVPRINPRAGSAQVTHATLDAAWKRYDSTNTGKLPTVLAKQVLRDVFSSVGAEYDPQRADALLAPVAERLRGKVSRPDFYQLFPHVALHTNAALSQSVDNPLLRPGGASIVDALPADVFPLFLRFLPHRDLQSFAACSHATQALVNSSPAFRARFVAQFGEPSVAPAPGTSWREIHREKVNAERSARFQASMAGLQISQVSQCQMAVRCMRERVG